jgi:hypothetical protein
MALTENTNIDRIEVVDMGIVQVRQSTVIAKNGEQVARSFHRWTLTPDMDISGQEQKVQDICNAAWTDEVKTAYETFKAEQAARMPI